jgi:hypothetical protein
MKKMNSIVRLQNAWVKSVLLFCLFTFLPLTSSAQCGIENNAFKSGEELAYDLYFNWKFIWVKVGTAEMDTKMAKFEGKDAWKSYLITRGNPKLDKFFVMRDTLLSYCNPDLSPLYFRKGAKEGDSYYVDEIWYSYPHGNCQLKKHRITSSGEHLWKTTTYKSCIYDMMSIFLRARNFDASKMKKNETIPMPVSDAMGLSNSWLEFRGRENYKMSDTKEKFRCLVFSFYERDNGKSKELLRFWVTDDENHIPVRLDMFLSFGSAKAYLKSYKGVRSPMTAKNK